MALAAAPTILTSGGGGSAASHTTASSTSTTDALLLLDVHLYVSAGSAQPATPTVTGLGLTWELVGNAVIVDSSGSDRASLFRFRAQGAGATGALTITPGSSQKASWVLAQFTGAVVGANGASAVTNFAFTELASVNAITTTSPTAASTSMLYGAVASQNTGTKTWGNSWTRAAEVTSNSVTYIGTGYFKGNTQLTQSVTWATAGRSGALVTEILEGGGPGTVTASRATTWDVQVLPGTLPGTIGGVEPEWHGHNPAMLAPNDNLYRVTESDNVSGNHPQMMRSTDGGATWAEVDSAHRPSAQDLEGTWISWAADGTTLIFTVNRDSTVWWCPFSTITDLWGTQEVIDSGLLGSGVEQSVSQVRTSDGQWWIFYSDTTSVQQISYRRRTGTNTYSAKVAGAFGANSVVGPYPVLGAGDVTYVFYTDDTAHQAFYRTLTSSGTLSAATRLDTSGTYAFSGEYSAIATSNAVYYDAAGTEVISVLYADTAGHLQLVQIVDGVKQAAVQIGTNPVNASLGTTTSDSIIAHLAVDGTTLHIVWSDSTTGNALHVTKTHGSAPGSVETLWDAGSFAVEYIFNNVYTNSLGSKVMGYTYDSSDHVLDASNIWYDEVSLTAAPTPVSASRATTWTTRTPSSATRATTWTVRTSASATRAATWTTRAPSSATRSTTWTTRTPASATRVTTWAVAGVTFPVAATRAATWVARSATAATRSTTWAVRTPASATRAVTWAVLGSAVANRVATWTVRTPAAATRSAIWNVDATGAVAASRSTSWVTRSAASTTRASSWETAASVTPAVRAASYSVLVSQQRSCTTTWKTSQGQLSARSTTWAVINLPAAVSASRATTWAVQTIGSVTSSRSSSWDVRGVVTPVARAASWVVFSSRQQGRATTWKVSQLATSSRAAVWNARSSATGACVAVWAVLVSTAATRATTWSVSVPAPTAARATTWSVAAAPFGPARSGIRAYLSGRDITATMDRSMTWT